MVQQRALAPGADAGDLVERRAADRLGALGAVGADRETVRLVAQPLQEIEHRVARLEGDRRPAGEEKTLAPGVAVRPFGDRRDRQVLDAEFGQHVAARR